MIPPAATVRAPGFAVRMREGMTFLAPALLAVGPALALAYGSPSRGEGYEWAQHALAGGGFIVAFLLTWERYPPSGGRIAFGAALAILVAVGAMITVERPIGYHVLFSIAGGLVAVAYWSAGRGRPETLATAPWIGLAATLALWAAADLWWWQAISVPLQRPANVALLLGLTAGLAACVGAWTRDTGGRNARPWHRGIDAMVWLALAVVLARTNGLDPEFTHHWSVYTAPAEMVRSGGALLDDVPSQYGLLNILLLALVPGDDRFIALYWLNTSLTWLTGVILHATLRSWLDRWWWNLTAGIIVVSCLGFFCGNSYQLLGPHPYPSVGAMRFVWVYLLLGGLVWAFRRNLAWRRVRWAGNGLWLLGTAWSVESAAYVSSIWLPAATLMALPPDVSRLDRFRRAATLLATIVRTLMIPGALLAGSMVALTLIYVLCRGHGPDFFAYFEYAVAFSGGFGALPIDPQGAVWILLLLHAALLAAVLGLDIDRDRAALALVCAAWGALWTAATYYVSRSHINNLAALSPVLLLIVFTCAHALSRSDRRGHAAAWLWIVVPVFAGSQIWLVGMNSTALGRQFAGYSWQPSLAPHLRLEPAARRELIQRARQMLPSPVSVLGMSVAQADVRPASAEEWLPLRSLPLLMPLPPARRLHYLRAARPGAGWLVFPATQRREDFSWLFGYLESEFTPNARLEQDGWHAIHYVPLPLERR